MVFSLPTVRICQITSSIIIWFQLCWSPAVQAADPGQLTQERLQARLDYQAAREAQQQADWSRYESLRQRLNQYPLAVYLDYYALFERSDLPDPIEVQLFLREAQGTPLEYRALSRYQSKLSKSGEWKTLLTVTQTPPDNEILRCRYHVAQLQTGDRRAAFAGARQLWLSGRSISDACDPLFKVWRDAGQLDDELIWQRMVLAFDAGQPSLLGYLNRQLSPNQQPRGDRLLLAYHHPQQLIDQSAQLVEAERELMLKRAYRRLAKQDVNAALSSWQQQASSPAISRSSQRRIDSTIAWESLLNREANAKPWLDAKLKELSNDDFTEVRLRWAINERDWPVIAQQLGYLSEQQQQADRWRYWRAASHQQMQISSDISAELERLSSERGYYGFLAADTLGKPYRFNQQPLELNRAGFAQLERLPAVQRVTELVAVGEERQARSEWYYLNRSLTTPQQEQLAELAAAKAWPAFAIAAANNAKAWDKLELRFPIAYQAEFHRFAKQRNLPPTELMAIARRESAFYPYAESNVGARGLMQLMPGTARQVAKQIGNPKLDQQALFDIETNLNLGSAYYRQLLDRFNNNRVLAVAAYNAGPQRVDQWRAGGLPVDVWIESIPYKETRQYVQAVLSYNVVFGHMQGEQHSLLTEQERQARY